METSSRAASVAVLRDDELSSSGKTEADQRTAAALAPLLASTLAEAKLRLSDVELIAVTVGPGSFTGLRVGVTTAKTLAYALNCDVLGVCTLEVVAWQSPTEIQSLWAVLDAQRQQLFAARFERGDDSEIRAATPTEIINTDTFVRQLATNEYVSGPGLVRFGDGLPSHAQRVPEQKWYPQAETVGRLAHKHFQGGRRDDFWSLSPLYIRPSAAEEKWKGRNM